MEKLLALLTKLSKKEMKSLQSYLSMVFKKGSQETHADKEAHAEQLFNHIKKYHPKFESKQLSEKIIYAKIFGSKDFKKQNLTKVVSQLNKELKRFLIWQSDDDSFEKELILLKKYKDLNLPKQVELQLNKMERQVEQDKNDSWYAYKKMRLAHEHYFDPRLDKLKTPDKYLPDAMHNLDNFYIFFKLFYAAEMLGIQQVRNNSLPQIQLFDEVQKLLTPPTSLNTHAVQLTIQLLQTREEKVYQALKHLLFENVDQFSQEHKQVLFTRLLNQIGYWIKQGKSDFWKECFIVYKAGIQQRAFIFDGIFDIYHYHNIMDIACKFKAFEWLAIFIKEANPNIVDEYSKSTEALSKAFIHFGKAEFQQAYNLLNNFNFRDHLYNRVRSRMLKIACAYELGKTEETYNLCDNCYQFIKKNKNMADPIKKSLRGFCKMTEKLLNSQYQTIDLTEEIQTMKYIYFKSWLLEKIQQESRKRGQY